MIATIPGTAFPARDSQNLPDRSQAVLLLQDVLVLAVGETLETKGTVQASARTVSLSLAPDQLARLALALRFGKVSVAIRNPGDGAFGPAAAATLRDIAQLAPPPPPPAPRRAAGIPYLAGPRVTSLVRSARAMTAVTRALAVTLMAVCSTAAWSEPAVPPARAPDQRQPHLQTQPRRIARGGQTMIALAEPATRLALGDPSIADVKLISDRNCVCWA